MKKFIFGIVLLLSMVSGVKASEIYLTRDKIDNVYSYYYDENLGRDRFLYAEKYIFEDRVAYCLELGKNINSNLYDFTTSLEMSGIKEEDLEYIKLVSYYGYDYPGHNTDKYYMATQELIWKRLSNNVKVSWVRNLNPSDKIDVSSEKENILMLVDYHQKKPSFAGMELEVTLGQEKVLLDNNRVLMDFESNDENVVLAANNLILTENFRGNEVVLRRKTYNDNLFFVYINGVSQKMLSTGMVDEIKVRFKTKLIGGSLTIHKLDKDTGGDVPVGDASLEGTVYELYDDNNALVDTLIIGKKEKISDLPLGKYYLKEKKAGEGYLLDDKVYDIEITSDNLDIAIDVYDEVIKRRVNIFKVFASDETGILTGEGNITFEIYDRSGNLYDKVTTDDDGYTSIVLPYGTYIFKQMNVTEGYEKIDDFEVSILEDDDRPIYKILANSEVEVRLRVVKKDLDTGENVVNGNIKFKLFDVKKNEFLSYKSLYPKEEIISEFEVDDRGVLLLPMKLGFGEYILYEVDDKMDGYLYNKEGVRFSIDNDTNMIKDDEYGAIVEIPFYNKRVKGNINIVKYGEDVIYENNSYFYKRVLLDGVIFDVYANEDIYENGILMYKNKDLVGRITTDKDGKGAIKSLPLGSYYVKEISSSNGNVVINTRYDVELKYQDQYTEEINYKLVVNNYLNKGKLIINKYEKNSDVRLPNTLMEIRDKKGRVVYNGYTDDNGQIVIDDLPYGEYYLSEIEASTGYRLLEDNIYFEINKEELEMDIYNDRIRVPNTGIANKDYFLIGGIISLFIFIMSIFFHMRAWSIFTMVMGIICFSCYGGNCYLDYRDRSNNDKNVNYYIENNKPIKQDRRYDYVAVLEIPSIELKRGFLAKDSEYNDVKYNIELLRYDERQIVLASHNGNNGNSYFSNLNKLNLGDDINIYYNGNIYEYIYSDSYEIKKDGHASIYCDDDKKSIVLITCSDDKSDGQVVHIGYLKTVSSY